MKQPELKSIEFIGITTSGKTAYRITYINCDGQQSITYHHGGDEMSAYQYYITKIHPKESTGHRFTP